MTPGRRSRIVWSAAAALAAVPVLVLTIAAVDTAHRTDLKCFWTGARLVASGLDPYDAAVWGSAVAGTFENVLGRPGPSPCPVPYSYPLTTAVLTLPLGVLPLELAAATWALLGAVGLVAGLALLARGARLDVAGAFALAFVALASQPAWWNALFLQYGGVLVAGLGVLAAPTAAASPVRSAFGMVLLGMKPHVVPLALLERFAASPRPARVAVLAVLSGVAGVSLALNSSWPLGWLGSLWSVRPELEAVSPTTWGLIVAVTGRVELAILVCALALAAFIVALRGVELRDPVERMSVAVVAWMLIAPYASMADLLVFAVAWCVLLRRRGIGVAFVVADVVPWLAFRSDPALGLGVVAPVTAVALALVLRTIRRSR